MGDTVKPAGRGPPTQAGEKHTGETDTVKPAGRGMKSQKVQGSNTTSTYGNWIIAALIIAAVVLVAVGLFVAYACCWAGSRKQEENHDSASDSKSDYESDYKSDYHKDFTKD